MKITFEYRNEVYDKLEDAEDAVAEYVGQNMNNQDPRDSGEYESECLNEIEVYVDGEWYGDVEQALKAGLVD